jgi:hypothetical protein
MTEIKIAEKTWSLWNDYYKDGDLGIKEILDIIENDIRALTIPIVVLQGEQFSLSDIYKIAQNYTEEQFIEMVKHVQG